MSLANTVKLIQKTMRKDAGVDGDAQRIGQLGWLLFLKIYSDLELESELSDSSYKSPTPPGIRWQDWADDSEGESLTGEALIDFVNNSLFPQLKNLDISNLKGISRERGALLKSVFDDTYNYMKNGTLLRQIINKINQDIDYNAVETRHLFGDIYEQFLKDLQSAGNAGEYYTPRAVTQFAVDMVNPQLGETVLDPACGTGGFLTSAYEAMKRQVKNSNELLDLKQRIKGVEKKQLPHTLCATNMMIHGIEVPSNIVNDNTLAKPLRDYAASDQVDVILTNPPFGGIEEDGIENNFPSNFRTRETADLFMALILQLLKDDGRAAVVLPDGFMYGEGVKTNIKRELFEQCNVHTIIKLPDSVFKPYAGQLTYVLFFEKGSSTQETWYYEITVPEGQKAFSKTKPITLRDFAECREWWGGLERELREESPNSWKVPIQSILDRNFDLDMQNPNRKNLSSMSLDEINVLIDIESENTSTLMNQWREFLSRSPLLSEGDSKNQTMVDSLLIDSEASSSLLKHIKKMATKGILFPHDLKETFHPTVVDLLDQGLVEKSPIANNWARGPVSVFLDFQYGSNLPAEKRSGGSVPVYGSNGITGYHDEPLISDPCIVVGRKGSVGALQLAEGPSWTTDVAYFVIAPPYFDLKFLYFLLGTLGLENLNRGVKPGLSRKMAYSISIDVPPMGEQIRIVREIEDAENLIRQISKSSQKLREYRNSRLEVTFDSLFEHYQ